MMDDQEKYYGFIVSAGRTGTAFFGDVLSEIIPGAFSVHQPDVVEGFDRTTFDRIRTFGWYHMVIGRLLGRTGIRNLSQRYLSGRMSRHDVVRALHRQRGPYYHTIDSDYIVESNLQWYGLLPVLSDAYAKYRVVGLVRDPRTWVTSVRNLGTQFGRGDLVTRLGFKRLDPDLIGDREYIAKWPDMTPFEKNCWQWTTLNSLIHAYVLESSSARLFRYEDLFLADDRVDRLREMLDFMTHFPDRDFHYDLDGKVLDTPRNASKRRPFAGWRDWNKTQARQLQQICGPLMEALGYGSETRWQELVS